MLKLLKAGSLLKIYRYFSSICYLNHNLKAFIKNTIIQICI